MKVCEASSLAMQWLLCWCACMWFFSCLFTLPYALSLRVLCYWYILYEEICTHYYKCLGSHYNIKHIVNHMRSKYWDIICTSPIWRDLMNMTCFATPLCKGLQHAFWFMLQRFLLLYQVCKCTIVWWSQSVYHFYVRGAHISFSLQVRPQYSQKFASR